MTKTKLFLIITLCFLVGTAGQVRAGGFRLSEFDAKASGMMNAFTAQADRPSAMHYNPAGIVQLDGIQTQAGFGYFIPSVAFETDGNSFPALPPAYQYEAGTKTDMENNTFLVPYVYLTYKINDQWSIGFSENTPFGLGTEWKGDWEGRYIVGGTKAEVKTINLQTTIAYRPLPNVAFAFSPQYQFFDVELQSKVPNSSEPFPTPATDLDLRLKGDTWNFGWNISTMVWLSENLKFGAYYQSAINHDDIEGKVDFSIYSFDAIAAIELPPSAVLGLAWIDKDFTVEFDVLWEGWSTYDKLAASSDSPGFQTIFGDEIIQQKNWQDSWTYSLGASYKVNPMYEVRAGIRKMDGCIPENRIDPLVPSQDRWYFSLGGGIELEQLAIDASFIYLTDDVKELGADVGDYDSDYGAGLGKVNGEFIDVSTVIFNLDVKYLF